MVYYIVCLVIPPIITYNEGYLYDNPGYGVPWLVHIIYFVFAALTFFMEIYMYTMVLERIKHLVPGLEISGSPDLIPSIIDWF